ncbi:uncharacterized protein LOC111404605 [Olea europaea var. sylvestris]|uniref:uncharacterized protein LOC111404605 n=1 Tax=Olea europaea var. sylvestris TaxID=158386 RepID=UPI000C1D446A|nr:uncharacterized protein LOC111404605 [Olea europaea var. sylvestris]
MATTSAMWSSERVIQKKPSGVYEVGAYSAISVKIDSLFHKYMEANNQFMRRTKATLQDQSAAIKNLETQMGQMAISMTGRAPGNLPSNTEINPKEQAKAITTRSGGQLLEIHVKRPGVTVETSFPAEDETAVKESTPGENSEKSHDKAKVTVSPYEPPIPFPRRLKKHKMEQQYKKFLEAFKKLHINIPLADALLQMPSYAKFLKDILSNKRKLEDHETIMLTEECIARIQKKLPPKSKDPGSFTVPCTIDDFYFNKALCDLGVSINLTPLSIFKKLGLGEPKATTVTLQLADRSLTHPRGIIEDVLGKVDKLIFPADFLILDMEEDKDVPIILGRPFLATARALIDVQQGQLTLRLGEEKVSFNVFKAMKYPTEPDTCCQIGVIDIGIPYNFELKKPPDIQEVSMMHPQSTLTDSKEIEICIVESQTDDEEKSHHLEKDRVEVRRINAMQNKTILSKLCRTSRAIFKVP